MRRLVLIGFLILNLVFSFKAGVANAGSTEIRVPDDYPMIQWAINAADIGDTIIVSPSVYHERIIINKTINLSGQNRDTTIIDASETGTAITITAPNVNVTGFKIRNGDPWGVIGGYLVSNNIVEMNKAGIKDAAILRNNIVRNNGALGPLDNMGILAHNSLVEENIVTDNFIGIEAHGSTIRNNLIKSSSWLGYAVKAGSSLVVGNTIKENYRGIYVSSMGYWGNTVCHNNFVDNEGQIDCWAQPQENTWDNGAEGNYWSDYEGNDGDGDGIGDTLLPHLGVDSYPLVEPWSSVKTFEAFKWNNLDYEVVIFSNNTIASFSFIHSLKQISFSVTGPSGSVGFCNVTIPKILLKGEPWQILVDENPPLNVAATESSTDTFLYFT